MKSGEILSLIINTRFPSKQRTPFIYFFFWNIFLKLNLSSAKAFSPSHTLRQEQNQQLITRLKRTGACLWEFRDSCILRQSLSCPKSCVPRFALNWRSIFWVLGLQACASTPGLKFLSELKPKQLSGYLDCNQSIAHIMAKTRFIEK